MYIFKCKDGMEIGISVASKTKNSDPLIKMSPEILIFPDLQTSKENFTVQFKNEFLFKKIDSIDYCYIDGFPGLIKEMNKTQDILDTGLYTALNFIYSFKDK